MSVVPLSPQITLTISEFQHLHPILHPKVQNWVFLYIINAAWRRPGSQRAC